MITDVASDLETTKYTKHTKVRTQQDMLLQVDGT
jgi:hypothetical protein